MVLPGIGGVYFLGGAWYAVDKVDGNVQEITTRLKDDLVNSGVPILDSIGDGIDRGLIVVGQGISSIGAEIGELGADLGTGLIGLGSEIAEELGDLGQDIGLGALKVIKGAGVALLEGAEDVVDYTWGKVSPHRVEAVTALTAIMIYVTTTVIIFKKIRGSS
tara:strand:- start:284 stop:769 length:486 start_codon:yes stop_codon:yes gene_type:complete